MQLLSLLHCYYCFVESAAHGLIDKLYCLLLQLICGKVCPVGCLVKVLLDSAMESPCQVWHVLLACAYLSSAWLDHLVIRPSCP